MLNTKLQTPESTLLLIALSSLGMLLFGIYLQEVVGLVPCPMCIVQRYCLILLAMAAGIAFLLRKRVARLVWLAILAAISFFGAFVAARQSWLQWHPPESVSCGRDLYGMIENLPIKRALPMIFAGSGDCTKVDWSFLGLSVANWAFLFFATTAVSALVLLVQKFREKP